MYVQALGRNGPLDVRAGSICFGRTGGMWINSGRASSTRQKAGRSEPMPGALPGGTVAFRRASLK